MYTSLSIYVPQFSSVAYVKIILLLYCRLDDQFSVKIADFGLTREVYSKDYYKVTSNHKLPVKWMALESLHDKISNEKTDVVSLTKCY